MSDLTKKQIEAGWTEERRAEYIAERNRVAADRIFGNVGNIDPRTGKPRRRLQVERYQNLHDWTKRGYDPHSAWRSKRNYGDE